MEMWWWRKTFRNVVVVVEGDKRNVLVVVVYSFTILEAVLKTKKVESRVDVGLM